MKHVVAALLLLAPQNPAVRHELTVSEREGERFCTIHADNALLHDVLRDLAEQAHISVDGLDASTRRTLVSVDLRERPLRQAVTFIAGSVGLEAEVRQGILVLRPGLEDSTDPALLRDAALAVSGATLRDFPDHALAPEALRNQAILDERQGRPASARARYDQLVERYPDCALSTDALFSAGELLMREEAWQDAADRFSELLRSEREHDLEVPARLELAWCIARLGQHERALYMMDALDSIDAAASRSEELRRAQVRVRALAGLGRGDAALKLLDDVDARLTTPADRAESLELRALACAAAGRRGDAARAWLGFAQLCEGPRKELALQEAATHALAANDEVGALFVAQSAHKHGIELESVKREARAALTLDDPTPATTGPATTLERAERLCDGGSTAEALKLLATLQSAAATFDESTRARFARCHVRAVAREVGIDTALTYLREQLALLSEPELRRGLYILAGELLERAGRIDEAIEAYRGRI
jgi:tetratricopeptide (TPR) repeat protein